MRRFRKGVFLLLACLSASVVMPAGRSGHAAVMSDYCQVPPFVVSNVLPNVMIVVSNSGSMRRFAYTDSHACTAADPCGGYDPAQRYYGYFNSGYWYSYGSNRFTPAALKTSRGKAAAEWDGNFLNWLSMRRIDALRRALTGGTVSGGVLASQIAAAAGDGTVKTFQDPSTYTPFTKNQDLTATFSTGSAATAPTFTVTGPGVSGTFVVNVDVVPGTTVEGVLQDTAGARARLGLVFYNSDNQGGTVEPAIGDTSLSSMVNRINTPSNINGGASQPLAEALYTVAGDFAQVTAAGGLGLSSASCVVGSGCEPRYHLGDYSTNVAAKDPYNFGTGGESRYPPCAKSFVLVIADGEPCGDGNIPQGLVDSTPAAYRAPAPPNWCGLGGNVAGAESVALWSHTTDLRSPTIGKNSIARTQNLTYYVIQAFGSGSALLRQIAINGSFQDQDNNALPNLESEYNSSGVAGHVDTFFEASQGSDLEQALRNAFAGILKRASSGTAASVLASGEGSGANLVQAVFYPRRRFGNDVILWTGGIQNLWFYIDPYLANASIREDTVADKILALDNDYLVRFVYDTNTDTTNIALNKTTATGLIDNTFSTITRPFEQAKSLWEAGKLLYLRSSGSRAIFSFDNTSASGRIAFIDNNAAFFSPYTNVPDLYLPSGDTTLENQLLIRYIRGQDFPGYARQRTVSVAGVTGSPDNVWKLGDIVHSTPRIAGGTPLNGYYNIYYDWTYKAFTDNTNYKNRGMVFTGANDGMLHAFKLGKLEFSGTWRTSPAQKARLSNFGDNSVILGTEMWAYVPRGALPYLYYLTDNNYCHLYYTDLSPTIVDASIGASTGDQSNEARTPASWRTILIGGMRTGGACRSSSGSCNSTTGGLADCVKAPGAGGLSSYFAIDITDASNPIVLWEFSNEQLGFATTGPAIVRLDGVDGDGNADRSRNGNWYVVLGSGPTGPIDNVYNQFMGRSDQPLRLFVLDLKTGALLRTVDGTGIANAFAGSLYNAAADFDLDYQDDAVFFGYVKKDDTTLTWTKGGVGRLTTGGDRNPASWTFSTVIDDIGPVTSAVVRLQNNNTGTNWLYFGEGRYYYERDAEVDDAAGQRHLYGIKDPCFYASNLYPGGCTSSVDFSDLTSRATADDAPVANGWYIPLASDNTAVDYGDGTGTHVYHAERVITDPLSVTTSGTVFFTAYRPFNELCNLGGKSFVWAVRYDTGGAPAAGALRGKALIQVSTASVEQIDLATAFSGANSEGGRRSVAMEGVPPIAQGLSILTPPPPVKKILHMKEH
ncbi:MAG: pilus assembly protein [Gemmatimonadota bacterium]